MERDDVIIVATVSAIYGLGDPVAYREQMVTITQGQRVNRDDVLRALVKIQYNRNDVAFKRGTFRVRGDTVELVFPSGAGTPGDLDKFRARNWPRLLSRAKVRPRVLYQCRHTFARMLLEQGDTPQHVAAMLGHTTVKMVFQVYGRWMSRPESTALARLDAAITSKAGHGSGHDSRLELAENQ